MLLPLLVTSTVVSIVLYYITINGINHFIDNSSSEDDEKSKDEIILKILTTILLLILLGCNGIIYYNSYDRTGTTNVVESNQEAD